MSYICVFCSICWLMITGGLQEALSISIDHLPTNTSVMLGEDARFSCGVKYQDDTSDVMWKKINVFGEEVLSFNNRSTYNAKYEIEGTYSLLIKDVNMDDEGIYACDTGVEQVMASLTVLVMMQNMTISWGLPVPFNVGGYVNLTCSTINSRPPAKLRWFRGSHEITNMVTSERTITRPKGFGDTTSMIGSVTMSVDVPFRCVADLHGYPAARTEFLFPPVTDDCSSSYPSIYSMVGILLASNIIFTILCRKRISTC